MSQVLFFLPPKTKNIDLLRCSAVSAVACSKVNYSLIFAATTAEEAFTWVTILKEVCNTIRGHNCHLSNGQRVTTFWNHSSCFVSLTRVMQRKRSEEKADTPARTKGCHHIVLLIFLAASHFGKLQNTLFPSLILPLCFLKFFTNRMYLPEG